MNNKKLLLLIVSIILTLATVVVFFGLANHQKRFKVPQSIKIDGTLLKQPKQINAFSMQSTLGKKFSKRDLKNHWTMMFFGFTNCGYVCPTTLSALKIMYRELEKTLSVQAMPRVVMATVDPNRDNIDRMKNYLSSFNKNFIGVRADLNMTQRLEKQMYVVAVKLAAKGSHDKQAYTINHSAQIILINPDAEIIGFFSFPHKGEKMAKDFLTILKHTAV